MMSWLDMAMVAALYAVIIMEANMEADRWR
jgi:hypothetical protein